MSRRSRPSLAEPPAESPSTMKSSVNSGVTRRAVARACRAGSRSRAGRFAARGLAGLAGGVAGLARLLRLLDNLARLLGVFFHVIGELARTTILANEGAHEGAAELRLGLALELGVGQFDGDDGGKTLRERRRR